MNKFFFQKQCGIYVVRMEFLFQQKHNQLTEDECKLIMDNKKSIASRITHMLDCEAYSNSAKKSVST